MPLSLSVLQNVVKFMLLADFITTTLVIITYSSLLPTPVLLSSGKKATNLVQLAALPRLLLQPANHAPNHCKLIHSSSHPLGLRRGSPAMQGWTVDLGQWGKTFSHIFPNGQVVDAICQNNAEELQDKTDWKSSYKLVKDDFAVCFIPFSI